MSSKLILILAISSALTGCGVGIEGILPPTMPMQCKYLRPSGSLFVFNCQGMGGISTLEYVDEDGQVDHWCVEKSQGDCV